MSSPFDIPPNYNYQNNDVNTLNKTNSSTEPASILRHIKDLIYGYGDTNAGK